MKVLSDAHDAPRRLNAETTSLQAIYIYEVSRFFWFAIRKCISYEARGGGGETQHAVFDRANRQIVLGEVGRVYWIRRRGDHLRLDDGISVHPSNRGLRYRDLVVAGRRGASWWRGGLIIINCPWRRDLRSWNWGVRYADRGCESMRCRCGVRRMQGGGRDLFGSLGQTECRTCGPVGPVLPFRK